jgi:hypothetical protein
MSDLVKSAAVLEIGLVDEVVGGVLFLFKEDNRLEDMSTPAVGGTFISYETWEDMGKPPTITVSVEPGDKLNEFATDAKWLRNFETVA